LPPRDKGLVVLAKGSEEKGKRAKRYSVVMRARIKMKTGSNVIGE